MSAHAQNENNTDNDSDEQMMLDAIGKWLEQKVRPVAMELEHDDVYPAALVKGAGPDAAAFLAFLTSPRGAAFFTARGFSAPE